MNRDNDDRRYFLPILFLGILVFHGCFSEQPGTIRVNGSTTVHPIMQGAVQRYGEGKRLGFQLDAEGSGIGIAALIKEECDIATSSRMMSTSEFQEAEARGLKIREFALANDLVVPIVHPANPVEDLSLDELKEIYCGNVRSWEEVGGSSGKILVVRRDDFSGTHDLWVKLVLENESLRSDCETKRNNSGVLAFVSENKNGIGYISGAFLNPEVKSLKVNGIVPSRENGKNGIYPIYRVLYLYVNEKALAGEIKSFIIFLLSDQGQEIVLESGFIPLNLIKTPPKFYNNGR